METAQSSFPVYYGKWSKLGPKLLRRGTILVSPENISLTSVDKEEFRAQPQVVRITVPFRLTFQLETPFGVYAVQPGKSWWAKTPYVAFSKEVRLTTKALLIALNQAGVESLPSD